MTSTYSGKWVFDSNLLVYSFDQNSPFFSRTSALFSFVQSESIFPVVAQQNIVEAEKVLVRAYKKDPNEVIATLRAVLTEFRFTIITPVSSTYETYHSLLSTAKGPGDIFDYYLAATMIDNAVFRIFTANVKDFFGIKDIEAVNPFK